MGVAENAPDFRKAHYATPKLTTDELLECGARLNRVSVDFLKIDVATGLTFTGIALHTDDAVKKARNRRSARLAYDTVIKLIDRVTLSHDDSLILGRNLARLRSELATLGENV